MSDAKHFLLPLLLICFCCMGYGSESDCIRIDGKPRYIGWAYRYISGPDSYAASLRMCHEMSSWGVTDIIIESGAIASPWPSEVKGALSVIGYNPPGDFTYHIKYDFVDALCRAAKVYNMKIWFAQMARDGYAYEVFFRDAWKNKGGPEFVRKKISEREQMGLYAKNVRGELLGWGGVDYKHHFDLNSPAVAEYFKSLLTELKNKYGHYNVIEGFVYDETELTLHMDTLEDDLADFKKYCQVEFGETYPGDQMPAFQGNNPDNVWWRREVLYRIEIMEKFLENVNAHAHKLGFKSIKCIRRIENFDEWSAKCGMDVTRFSKSSDYVWMSTGPKYQLDPYLNYDNFFVGIGMAYGKIASRFSQSFHGKNLSDHAYPLGTTTNQMTWYNDTERKLFFGHQNNRNFFRLFNRWTGGVSPAKIAIAIHSLPFVMQYPKADSAYKKHVVPFFEILSENVDVDGFQLTQTECLRKYPAVIVPHGMAHSLPENLYRQYRSFVENGGTLFSLDCEWSTGNRDLTGIIDKTQELTGCRVVKTKDGYSVESVIPAVKVLQQNPQTKKAEICEYKIGKGRVISVWNSVAEKTASGDRKAMKAFAGMLETLLPELPVRADGNLQITQTLLKDNKAAIVISDVRDAALENAALAAAAKLKLTEAQKRQYGIADPSSERKTRLFADVQKLGIKGALPKAVEGEMLYSVRDIITGREIESPYRDKSGRDLNRYNNSWTASELLRGIPLQLKFPGEFKVIAIGAYETLEEFDGVMPGVEWSDAQSNVRQTMETPEGNELFTKDAVKKKDALRIGVLQAYKEAADITLGVGGILKFLHESEDFVPVVLPDYDLDTLKSNRIDVLVFNQVNWKKFPWMKDVLEKRNQDLKGWVESGKGLLVKHDAAGYREYQSLFPEICKGGFFHTYGLGGLNKCSVVADHAAVNGTVKQFEHSYPDHVQLRNGPDGVVLIRDAAHKKAVVIAGCPGKGRYIADGTINLNPKEQDFLSNDEAALLSGYLKWLAGKNHQELRK